MAQGSFVATLQTATPQQAKDILDSAVKAGATSATAVASAAPKPIAPGVERWHVKVGADPDADQVGGVAPGGGAGGNGSGNGPARRIVVDSSVRELGAIPRPADLLPATAKHPEYDDKRVAPVETTVWRVQVQIIALRLEQDGDYHLVLQDASGATMVAEVPLPKPAFVPTSSPFFDDIATARAVVDGKFKTAIAATAFVPSIAHEDAKLVPASTFAASGAAPRSVDLASVLASPETAAPFATRIEPTDATIIGVGFFDYDHGQTGNSPNILELHPVLDIQFTG